MTTEFEHVIASNQPTFELRAFLELYEDLAPFLLEPCSICIDLSYPSMFGPSGMVPLVALIDYLLDREWEVAYVPPESGSPLSLYWDAAGWRQALGDEELPNPRSRKTYIPIVRFVDHQHLNASITAAIDVLSTTSEYPRGVLNALEFALTEVTDNVLVHSGARGWLQVIARPNQGTVDLVVADCGAGIPTTLRHRYPQVASDADLLQIATERGTTRDASVGQGNGLAGCLRISEALSGWMNIASRSAHLMRGDDGVFRLSPLLNFPGSIVSLTLRTSEPINLTDALWGYTPPSSFEISHVTQSGILFVLENEKAIYGNRATGADLALRLKNMINENPAESVMVDFAGIEVMSASFLDEFIAKLATRVGLATFFSKVQLINKSPFVERTLNEVLTQRVRSD